MLRYLAKLTEWIPLEAASFRSELVTFSIPTRSTASNYNETVNNPVTCTSGNVHWSSERHPTPSSRWSPACSRYHIQPLPNTEWLRQDVEGRKTAIQSSVGSVSDIPLSWAAFSASCWVFLCTNPSQGFSSTRVARLPIFHLCQNVVTRCVQDSFHRADRRTNQITLPYSKTMHQTPIKLFSLAHTDVHNRQSTANRGTEADVTLLFLCLLHQLFVSQYQGCLWIPSS